MSPLTLILTGVALPAVVCGLLYAAAWRIWPRPPASDDRDRRPGGWGPAIAVSLGFAAGFVGLEGWPGLPPLEALGWLPWLALATALAGLAHAGRATLVVGVSLRVVLSLATPLLILRPLLEHSWGLGEGSLRVAASAMALLAIWWLLDALAPGLPGPSVPLALWVALTGASVCIVAAGSARMGQIGGALAAALGAAVVASFLATRRDHVGATAVGCVLLAGLLLNGYFYLDDLPLTATVLIGAAPLAILVGRRVTGIRRVLAVAATAAIPVAVAVALTIAAMPDDPYY